MRSETTTGQRALRATIVGVGVFSVLFAVFFPYWAKRIMKPAIERDRLEAPLQTGEATIAVYIPAHAEEPAGRYYPPKVMVRFQGELYEPRDVRDAAKLHEQQPVTVGYRVGKSGRVYVDTAQAAGK